MPKTKPSDNLEAKMQVVLDKLARSKVTNQNLERAQARHNQAKCKIDQAVRAYNSALAGQIIAALVAEKLGLCQTYGAYNFHLAPEAGMMGIITSGTITRGDHYYERDEHFIETKLKCQECRKDITIRPGNSSLVELDARAYWTKFLRNKLFGTLYSTHTIQPLLDFAAEHGIAAQPITSESGGHRIGDSHISYNKYYR